jgi:hypothetical protein
MMSKIILNYNNFEGTRSMKVDKGDSITSPNFSTLNGIVKWGDITNIILSASTVPIYASVLIILVSVLILLLTVFFLLQEAILVLAILHFLPILLVKIIISLI